MRIVSLLLLATGFLSACVAKERQANIEYVGMKPHGNYHYLHFKSDIHLLELFARNKHQKFVLAELVCSLDNDQNLAFQNSLKHFATGRLEFIAKAGDDTNKHYVFGSLMLFWKSLDSTQTSNEYMNRNDLEALFRDRKEIPCIVRMAVYLSSPYYSDVMFVPTKDILDVTAKSP